MFERTAEARDVQADGRAEKLARLVGIARRLSSSLDPTGVVELAIDAAIEFAGAERGFVVLAGETADGASLRVLAPRNLTGTPSDGDISFSRGIAERVVRTGEPVITSYALEDERFVAQRSIHAMRLASVLSVPVRGPEGVLGALYLDHRFVRGAFAEVDLELVTALADHVAVALVNARLHAALRERTAQLDAERARNLALYREKAYEAERLAEEIRAHELTLAARFGQSRIIGRSASMRAVFDKIARVARSNVSVLVTGGPFVAINCGAIPELLLESELFGHRAGAFTGAHRDRPGLVVSANGGTLFLDEVGEMPASLQVKLLRVLQEREVQAIGALEPTRSTYVSSPRPTDRCATTPPEGAFGRTCSTGSRWSRSPFRRYASDSRTSPGSHLPSWSAPPPRKGASRPASRAKPSRR